MRIAIVGTGIAGLGSAHLLGPGHDIVVYEKDRRLGGHAETRIVAGPDGPVAVDTGFIVYNERNYPLLTRLFAELGVPTRPTTMSFGVSVNAGQIEYSGQSPRGLFAQFRNVARPGFLRMLGDILRFNARAPVFLRSTADDLPLVDFLDRLGVGDGFKHWYLLPMAAAIWSAPMATVMGFSTRSFLGFFDNHGLLSVVRQLRWRTVEGGSRVYVERLARRLRGQVRTGAAVALVREHPDGGLEVVDQDGHRDRFDRVVLACHADQALAMLDRPSERERSVLSRFPFQPNRTILHSDPTLMPRRRAAWSSWNYIAAARAGSSSAVSVTYWMNRLQELPDSLPLFVSLNPVREPADALVHAETVYDHPLFSCDTPAAQRELAALQGERGIFYAGAWTGSGFHEDGLRSAHEVAARLGMAPRPGALPGRGGSVPIGLRWPAAAGPER